MGDVAIAAFQVASQTSHADTEESRTGTHTPSVARTELSNTTSDSKLELVPPRDLWDEAYEALRETNTKLVEQYEETIVRIDQAVAHLGPVGSVARQDQLSAFITRRLDSIEKDKKSLVVAGKTIVLHEQVNRVVRIIMFAKDFVSSAVNAEPHAALAWTGVCLLLPVSIQRFRVLHSDCSWLSLFMHVSQYWICVSRQQYERKGLLSTFKEQTAQLMDQL